MRWESGRRSTNIEDHRGRSVGRVGAGLGAGGLLIAVVLSLLGAPPEMVRDIVSGTGTEAPTSGPVQPRPAAENRLAEFTSVVLADTEDVWGALFAQTGRRYEAPKLRLFTGRVQSACGGASAAVGPFYCPLDRRVFLDLSFFNELDRRFGAAGDFAQAYVIAHEVGHHVQTLTGVSERVHARRRQLPQEEANALSVRQELQADCLAGVWAHHAQRSRQVLEPGDLEEALTAATAIGDDNLQKRAGREVVPESFTHGTSKQRVRWFRTGFDSGNIDACDTFRARDI